MMRHYSTQLVIFILSLELLIEGVTHKGRPQNFWDFEPPLSAFWLRHSSLCYISLRINWDLWQRFLKLLLI